MKTQKFYRIDLTQFHEFLATNNFTDLVAGIDKHTLKAYIKELHQWKPKTIKRKIATIKAFFNYLEFEDVIPTNPLRKIKIKVKEPVILPKALTKDDVAQILTTAYQQLASAKKGSFRQFERTRDAAIIELLFATGARVSEVANLKIADLNLETGQVSISGKGGKERLAYLCNQGTLDILRRYCDLRNNSTTTGYLWINRRGRKLTDQSIRNSVKRLTAMTRINQHVTPHVFRHTFATLLLENDVDIKYIQSLLGHSSINTTQIYTQVNREKQQQLMLDKHPRHELSLSQ